MVQPRVQTWASLAAFPGGQILTSGGPSHACRQPRTGVLKRAVSALLGRLSPIWRAFELWRPRALEPDSSKARRFGLVWAV